MKTLLPFALLLSAGLAGCNNAKPSSEPEAANSVVAEEPIAEPEPVAPPPPPPRAAERVDPAPVAEAPPPPEPTSADEQMMEDAEATGMTARVAREEAAAANEAVPAESK